MGIFESIKSAFSTREDQEPEVTISPSQALRDAGIDASNLKFAFSTGTISVSGEIADAADRQRILDVLNGLPDISAVQDHMTESAPESPPSPEASETPEAPPATGSEAGSHAETESEDGLRMYTVEAGDTLWKVAQDMYGDGSKYMKIFEANTSLLKDPDHIYPGQELKIPRL